MLRRALSVFSIISALAAGISPSVAEDFRRTVPAGKQSPIGSIGTYNTFTCAPSAVPQARVSRQPEHGKVKIVEVRHTMNAGRCGTVAANVLVIYYTPEPGYRGPDSASVDFLSFAFAEGQTMRSTGYTFQITVK